MSALIEVILPVFIVIGFGYAATWRKLISDSGIDGLMTFTQGFAIPCLLFRAISTLDLGATFNPALLASFYGAFLTCFILGTAAARLVFRRDWEDSVAIGFCCMFSNTVLLGLPITERAYGEGALAANYAIIAFHAPFGYLVGITTMEIVRSRGASPLQLSRQVVRAMFHNALIIGILLGIAVNLSGVSLPGVLTDAVDMMIRAALPAALFGLGGVLYRYRPEGDMRVILTVCAISLLVHPTLTYALGRGLALPVSDLRSAVVTAGVAPGVNAYIFANIYGRARRVAASAVLLSTGLCILTLWGWLALLP